MSTKSLKAITHPAGLLRLGIVAFMALQALGCAEHRDGECIMEEYGPGTATVVAIEARDGDDDTDPDPIQTVVIEFTPDDPAAEVVEQTLYAWPQSCLEAAGVEVNNSYAASTNCYTPMVYVAALEAIDCPQD